MNITKIIKIETMQLKAIHSKCFNATINAFRSKTLVNFLNHFESDLSAFFEQSSITYMLEGKETEQKSLLHIAYSNLLMKDLDAVFLEVLKQREIELSYLFVKNDISLDTLSDIEHNFYGLLYKYGDKLGGYLGISSLNIQELNNIITIFSEIEKKEKDKLLHATK